ncbi:MAG: cadmium-translocating P-type ATPase [Clostridia bacterium]|nr:cadmium-translocating P-type ATPase [Clostridia bacterium]
MTKKQKKLLLRILISLALFVAVIIIEKTLSPHRIAVLLMYLVPYFVAGYDVLSACIKKILKGKFFDEEFLMTIATVGALVVGEYPESVFVMVFFQAGELFQKIAVGKSRRSISSLMELAPDCAAVIRDGEEDTVFSEEVSVGETVIVRPGEKIPLDGIITEGESAIDMKALTGESTPVDVYTGAEVKSGSINLTGTLKIEVLKGFSESTAAKILELVENSTLNKAKTEKFLTKFSRVYTPAVVISALLLAVVPSIITGDWKTWLYRGLIFLVVSCPCALVISVPLSYFGGIGGASSKGILIKGASFLEALGNVSTFVFDKTGTLTTGEFSVDGVFPEEGFTKEELLDITARAEYYSNHPLAKGIVKAAGRITAPDSIKEYPGGGVEAVIDGKTVLSGNARFLTEKGITISEKAVRGTAVLTAADGKYAGFIRLCDSPKAGARKTIEELHSIGVKKTVMLTGDRDEAAKNTAEDLGIGEYRSSLLPGDKADYVKELCESPEKGSVAFVGDGINDAPVLALSHVGIAMGGVGSDAAIEASDVVIMDDSIEKCVLAVKIAKKTRRIVRENVVFALGVKFLVLILAAAGLTNMWVGVFADVGVAVIAILNAMRTLKS